MGLDIFLRLKEATAGIHQQVEERLPIFRPDFNLTDYLSLLEHFYGFWAPLEENLSKLESLQHEGLALNTRLKTALLEKDLRTLGSDPGTVPICSKLPRVENINQAIGCFYVLEGSTLGARIISKHLDEHLQLTQTTGASFFNAYGEMTSQRWSSFKNFVEARVLAEDADEIVASASETFGCLFHWLQ